MRERLCESVLDLIGSTPLIRLSKMSPQDGAQIFAKLEAANPAGSVKDRPALSMVLAAERNGMLHSGSTIVEATSGNTGISLAMISAVRGYACILVMPEDMSVGRRHLLRAFGAQVVVTKAEEGMTGAVERAEQIVRDTAGAVMVRQFDNAANPEAHVLTTAEEIWNATEGNLHAFVAGIGTGGTFTGVGSVLRQRNASIRLIAVEPRGSAVLSGGPPGLHGIQGLGAGFVPRVLDRSLIDEIVTVTDLAADRMAKRIAREEGMLVGPSAGANVHAAVEIAKQMPRHHRVVTILCDSGERYLS